MWGTFAHCRETLRALETDSSPAPPQAKAIILLHGLGRSRTSMAGMAQHLDGLGTYTIVNLSYASTRDSIAAHARALAHVIENLEGVEEINFVAHSMGNLVIRHYLSDQRSESREAQAESRINRIVMLAPPNSGTRIAAWLEGHTLFDVVLGTSGQELAEWKTLQAHLAVPTCEFAIIAGSSGGRMGNPLLPGQDDLIVSIEETLLPGARDFVVVDAVHSTIMDHEQVREYICNFIVHGYLISEEARHSIPKDE